MIPSPSEIAEKKNINRNREKRLGTICYLQKLRLDCIYAKIRKLEHFHGADSAQVKREKDIFGNQVVRLYNLRAELNKTRLKK